MDSVDGPGIAFQLLPPWHYSPMLVATLDLCCIGVK